MAEPYRFDEFIIDSMLGEGGMGKVFRARQVALDRWVALKVLLHTKDQVFIDRFYREARSAARLMHPNIIQIHTVGEHGGIPYFAMEYIEGADLENLLTGTAALTNDETGEIIRSVAKALAVAMEHSIVHRDIKPANIMVTKSGLIKVMDFGLAKHSSADQGLTQSGMIVGTPSYMSPEQGASKPVDTRSDIYSLGCVMYHIMCGKPPFASENVASLLYKHMYENPDPPSSLVPGVLPEFETICLKMLKKDPAERYQHPQEILEALAQVPLNHAAAELSLAKRALQSLEAKQHSVKIAKTMFIAEEHLVLASKSNDVELAAFGGTQQEDSIQNPALTQPEFVSARPISGHAQQNLVENMSSPPPAPSPARTPTPMPTPRPMPPPQRPPSGIQIPVGEPLKHAPTEPDYRHGQQRSPPAAASTKIGSSPKLKIAIEPEARKVPVRVNETFQKLADGRWSYKPQLPECQFREGMAAELPSPAKNAEGLGDCLLCANWSKRIGCVLAYCQDLEARNRLRGLKLVSEQAIAWTSAGRFEKAIGLLDIYIRNNPDDPEAYRELASIYERPEYKGRDKRRVIVLYQRFLELARGSQTFSRVDIARIEERFAALSTGAAPSDKKSSTTLPRIGIVFQCFYRRGGVCFCFGALTGSRLIIVKAGEVEPDNGVTAAEMGSTIGRATTSIFRILKSDQSKKDDQTAVKKELGRLSEIAVEDLHKEPGCQLDIPCEQIKGATVNVDEAVGIRCISLKTDAHLHQLLFLESSSFKAEQCFELLRRILKLP